VSLARHLPTRRGVGIDFGTTNSALAVACSDGVAELAAFADGEGVTHTFRSILFFDPEAAGSGGRALAVAGPEAVRRYLDVGGRGRLIQSMKSHLATRLFTETSVFGHAYRLADLIAVIIRAIRVQAEACFGELGARVTVGRPAHFSGASTGEDDEFALGRLRAGFQQAGFHDVRFEYEPVAAAYQYEQQLDHDELVLIADFGGGTSDFSLVRLGPSRRDQRGRGGDILGVDGVGIAGDMFDSRIVRAVVAPHLGLGSTYRSAFDQTLPVPLWLYEHVEKWEHLSFLKSKQTMDALTRLQFAADEPEKLAALIHLVNDDLGYQLYRAVERTKFRLSEAETSRFAFRDPPVHIDAAVERPRFESWIEPQLQTIESCVARLLTRCAVAPGDVDTVFLTGGSAFVPAVRRIFAARFGARRLRGGEELTTVARGLALRALVAED
jgi:hypothetical chaperone protein